MRKIVAPILGPFGWPRFEEEKQPLPDHGGVYLQTFSSEGAFLIYGVGLTHRPLRKRFLEHSRKFEGGDYNIMDVCDAKQGTRTIYWKGWGWDAAKRAQFDAQKDEIVRASRRQMSETYIFVIDSLDFPRSLQRLEAAIVAHFYLSKDTLIDRGMHLSGRKSTETPVVIKFESQYSVEGLPLELLA